MKRQEAFAALEAAGTAQNRKVYARHGVRGPAFGVSFAELRKLARRIKVDHELARGLWASGNHDARVLATLVADPRSVTSEELERWARDLDDYVLTDALAAFVARTPHAREKAESWCASDHEFLGQAGYDLVALMVGDARQELSDEDLERRLAEIEAQIHGRKNRVRHAMNQALIAIGLRNPHLEALAVAAAGRIGKVEVDHGETGCKTPDAVEYIAKTLAYRRKKAANSNKN